MPSISSKPFHIRLLPVAIHLADVGSTRPYMLWDGVFHFTSMCKLPSVPSNNNLPARFSSNTARNCSCQSIGTRNLLVFSRSASRKPCCGRSPLNGLYMGLMYRPTRSNPKPGCFSCGSPPVWLVRFAGNETFHINFRFEGR